MTMRLKFAGTSADESFTDIFRKPLNLMGRDNVLEDRPMAHQDVCDADVRAQDLRTKGLPVMEKTPQRFVEPDGLAEMLEEMSLSTLLYYVLAGEGANKDESS